jgi:hypothetical protein
MTTKHQYVLCYSRSSLRTSRRSGRQSVSIGPGSSSTYPRRCAVGTVAPPKVPPVRATPPHPRPRSLCYAPSRNLRGPHPIKQSSVRQKTCQECRRGTRIAQSGALCTFLHESSPPWTDTTDHAVEDEGDNLQFTPSHTAPRAVSIPEPCHLSVPPNT